MTMRAKRPRHPAPERGEDARQFGARALKRLVWLMENASSEQAQVAAAKELLERVHGPAGPSAASAGDAGLRQVVTRLSALRRARRER